MQESRHSTCEWEEKRAERRTWKKVGGGGSFFRRRKKFGRVEVRIPNCSRWWGQSGARGECKKKCYRERNTPLLPVYLPFARGWTREIYRVFQKVSFRPHLLAHAMRHEVTRYSIPTDQFGGKRSNLSWLKGQLTSDRLAVAPTISVDLLAYNKYRDRYLSEIL